MLLNRIFGAVAHFFLGKGLPYPGLFGFFIVLMLLALLIVAGLLVGAGYVLGSG